MVQLLQLPGLVEKTLALDDQIRALAEVFAEKHHALFLGRGPLHAIAMEGALKLKEISYIHAEAYAAAELKHGPLALVDEHMPVITVAPNNELLEKLKSNLHEVRARAKCGGCECHPDAGAGEPSAGARGVRGADAAARVSRGGAQGDRCRSAAEPGEERDGRVRGFVSRAG
jgi:glucosamine--fructose-6-phosphate aminotransferase (isomerizing)